jgi:hypothetical protein
MPTESTVRCTGRAAVGRAERRVPGVAGVTVGVATSCRGVKPSPVGIKYNGLSRSSTARRCALRDRELGVALSCVGAYLLRRDDGKSGKSEESVARKHVD